MSCYFLWLLAFDYATFAIYVCCHQMLMTLKTSTQSRIEELPKCREVQWEEKAALDCWTLWGSPALAKKQDMLREVEDIKKPGGECTLDLD